MDFQRKKHSKKNLLDLYYNLLKTRMIEEKMIRLLKQGKISKWFSGIGQEAISIGATLALEENEYILPMHRNLGVFVTRNISLTKLFSQFQGKANGFTKGRDRSFHFGTHEHHIIGMISHLGPQLALADGIALANLLEKNEKTTLVFTGEGGTSEGDFHEALNLAAVWDLPVIFFIENNGYSISTPTSEQFKIKSFAEKGPAYGIETHVIDGNNVLEIFETIQKISKSIKKKPRPVLIEAKTFRMRGHEESASNDFVPKDLFEEWAKKDPLFNYEKYLKSEGLLDLDTITTYSVEIENDINEAVRNVFEIEEEIKANPQQELQDVFAPYISKSIVAKGKKIELRYVDTIRHTLDQNLARNPKLILMGQDIAEFGGVFKATEGLVDTFGKDKIRNTPLCESAVIGAGLGLAINGYKSVIEMQFGDFVSCGFNQIVNNLAKSHYRWGQAADVVVRLPSGAGTSAGPFHSQTNEAWFYRVPGLKIVYPSTPYDVKGLLNTAIDDPNPYIFLEHKSLYRSVKEFIPEEYYTIEVGKANIIKKGNDLSIVTYGIGVHWCESLLAEFDDYDIELIDLRSLLPWDKQTIEASVKKTGRLLLLTEDNLTGSIISDIAAWVSEHLFQFLDAPVKRVGSLDTPIPFAKNLEDQYLAKSQLKQAITDLLEY